MWSKVRFETMNKESLVEFIRKIAIEKYGNTKEEINEAFQDTLGIACCIPKTAHYEQERENGSPYIIHPLGVCNRYRALTNYENNDFDLQNLQEHGIPFYGVQEVCMLHDVIEDWMATVEDIEAVYEELGFSKYFKAYIKEPLMLITHDKSVDYETYINIVLKNPISALVKLLDLNDNMNIFGLGSYGDKEAERMHRYVKCVKMINDRYHFIEKFNKYRRNVVRKNEPTE